MQITITTPALLFPAISLLLLAYTNRFLALAALVRELQGKYGNNLEATVLGQIENLLKRLRIIRNMQFLGAFSFFLCVLSMFFLFMNKIIFGELVFGGSLVFLMGSLALSIWEIQISVDALELQMSRIEESRMDNLSKKKDGDQ